MRTVRFNNDERDTKLVKRIAEYKEKQGLSSFVEAVRILCEDALDYKEVEAKRR